MTLELLHVTSDYNIHLQGHQYQSHTKDMKYAYIRSIKYTESLTKSVQNTESEWQ